MREKAYSKRISIEDLIPDCHGGVPHALGNVIRDSKRILKWCHPIWLARCGEGSTQGPRYAALALPGNQGKHRLWKRELVFWLLRANCDYHGNK